MQIDEMVDGKRYQVIAEGKYDRASDNIVSDQGKTILGPMIASAFFPQDAASVGVISITRIEDPLPTEPGSIIEDAVGDILKLHEEDGWTFGYESIDEEDIQRPFTVLRIGCGGA